MSEELQRSLRSELQILATFNECRDQNGGEHNHDWTSRCTFCGCSWEDLPLLAAGIPKGRAVALYASPEYFLTSLSYARRAEQQYLERISRCGSITPDRVPPALQLTYDDMQHIGPMRLIEHMLRSSRFSMSCTVKPAESNPLIIPASVTKALTPYAGPVPSHVLEVQLEVSIGASGPGETRLYLCGESECVKTYGDIVPFVTKADRVRHDQEVHGRYDTAHRCSNDEPEINFARDVCRFETGASVAEVAFPPFLRYGLECQVLEVQDMSRAEILNEPIVTDVFGKEDRHPSHCWRYTTTYSTPYWGDEHGVVLDSKRLVRFPGRVDEIEKHFGALLL